MTIPMIDLAAQHADIAEEVEAGIRAVMASGQFILGPQVAAFEREAADFLGVAHGISCASGTDALHLALRALDIGPGDEIITTPFTFFATVEAIRYVGAQPVFADIDPYSFNLDPAKAAAAITPKTRAILPVHLFGQPVVMEPLRALADRHGLLIVEDCAQSFGARRNGRATGAFGEAGCFSFFPTKNLGAYGDGGMVATNSAEFAARLKALRNHGSGERHRHTGIGYNSRLDEVQAVVLRIKLKRIDHYNEARRRLARYYSDALADLPGLVTPLVDPEAYAIFNQYTVLVPDRAMLCRVLQRQGVGYAVHYPLPLYRQPALAADYPGLYLPEAEAVCQHCVSLPLYPEMSTTQIDRVVSALRQCLANDC